MSDRLRIAVLGPPWYPIPPNGYGGTELVVHLLHRELRQMGHEVLVVGADGSGPGVEALAPASWGDDLGSRWQPLREATYMARVFARLQGQSFDVVHDHSGTIGTLLAIHTRVAPIIVHTLHGQLTERYQEFYREVDHQLRLVAISAAQAASARNVRVSAVIHNAVDVRALRTSSAKEGYLVEVARICPEKGQHLAIEVARRSGRRLILAGKVEPSREGRRYFREQIAPHLGARVQYRENVAGAEKAELLAHAAAGIFPLQWPEPFGLALVECMASGTPTLALACGSAPELIEPGVTGFLATDVDQLVRAVGLLDEVDPAVCGAVARERFSPRRMAEAYLQVYGLPETPPQEVQALDEWPPVRTGAPAAL